MSSCKTPHDRAASSPVEVSPAVAPDFRGAACFRLPVFEGDTSCLSSSALPIARSLLTLLIGSCSGFAARSPLSGAEPLAASTCREWALVCVGEGAIGGEARRVSASCDCCLGSCGVCVGSGACCCDCAGRACVRGFPCGDSPPRSAATGACFARGVLSARAASGGGLAALPAAAGLRGLSPSGEDRGASVGRGCCVCSWVGNCVDPLLSGASRTASLSRANPSCAASGSDR
mmetsp:Transcript_105002/g.303827  ORF Transcript_105002/g.303827 Transcript_105002/m.303827 type:complete len:232 (-) Transcript_105002:284-979(-)